jgi:D-arabinose 1-dehydrogenase-like Zn-dependent alcohol dehydrogenase
LSRWLIHCRRKNIFTKFRIGDKVGVGCFVDSCRQCEYCKTGKVNEAYERILKSDVRYRFVIDMASLKAT